MYKLSVGVWDVGVLLASCLHPLPARNNMNNMSGDAVVSGILLCFFFQRLHVYAPIPLISLLKLRQ